MFKKIGLLTTIVIIVCLLLYFIPIRHKINATFEGVQCRIGDDSYSEKVSLTVQGNYFSYLFKNDRYEGKILIDKYEDTLNGSWVFPLEFTNGWSPLNYQNVINGLPIQYPLGSIYCTTDFRQILIFVSEPINGYPKGWDGNKGLYISFPSKTKSQAVNMAKKLSKRNKDLSLIHWN